MSSLRLEMDDSSDDEDNLALASSVNLPSQQGGVWIWFKNLSRNDKVKFISLE